MQRAISCFLASTMLVLSPGPRASQAFAQVVTGAMSGPAAPGGAAAGAAGRSASGVDKISLTLGAPNLAAGSLPGVASLSPALNPRLKTPVSQVGGSVFNNPGAPASINLGEARTGGVRRPEAGTGGVRRKTARIAAAAQAFTKSAASPDSTPGQIYRAGGGLQDLLSGAFSRRTGAAFGEVESPRILSGALHGASGRRLFSYMNKSGQPAAGAAGGAAGLVPEAPKTAPKRAAGGFLNALKKSVIFTTIALVMGVFNSTIALGQNPVNAPGPQAPVPAQKAPLPALAPGDTLATQEAAAALQNLEAARLAAAKVKVSVSVSPQGVTVGEKQTITITVRNDGAEPVSLTSVRRAVEESLPFQLELSENLPGEKLVLAPGESREIAIEIIPFDAGTIAIEGAELEIDLSRYGAVPEDAAVSVSIPKIEVSVASVLTPDWKEVGFKDIVEIKRGENPDLLWLLGVPMGLLLLIGVERMLAARRRARNSGATPQEAADEARRAVAVLERKAGTAPAAAFHAELFSILDRLIVDSRGLPKRERDSAALLKDAEASGAFSSGQISLARKLALEADRARFGGAASPQESRRKALIGLKALIDDLGRASLNPHEARQDGASAALGVLALAGAASFQFANPWVLLLLAPLAGFLAWRIWTGKKRGPPEASFKVSDGATLSRKASLRQRLAGLPTGLRVLAMAMVVLALAKPQFGVERTETYVPSTDTVIAGDISGSMSGKNLEGLKEAIRAYVIEQRRGTSNRVGFVTFDDDPYLDVRLTTDYDALIAHLKELETKGSTAVGKAVLEAVSHFIEINALELNDASDPRVAKMREILQKEGLSPALEFAKQHKDLLDKMLQPQRTKIAVLFTDGGSNSGIAPKDAARIAKKLGIRVYTVGIGTNGSDEAALKEVADITGALYFRAEDSEGMKDALLDINRLEKSPSLVKSRVVVKDLQMYFILLALLALGFEVALSSTKLRKLGGYTLILGLALQGLPGAGTAPAPEGPAAAARTIQADGGSIAARLLNRDMPAEMSRGNSLYLQGDYLGALKQYGRALERHPDIPEIYFNMGNAYLKTGDIERAVRSYQEYLNRAASPREKSEALYNMGNAALMQQDGEKAMELYREALRTDPSNSLAKWNLEVLMRKMEEAQKNGQQQQDQKGKKGKKGQKGQKGDQKGQKGDQKGEKGDQDGESGDQQGESGDQDGKKEGSASGQAKPTDKERGEGVDELIQEQGAIEKEGQEKQNKGITKKGKGVWGAIGVPLALASSGMTFTNPVFLWALAVVLPAAAGLLIYSAVKKVRAARALSPLDAPKDLRSWRGYARWRAKSLMLLTALALTGLSLGGPVWGDKDTRLNFGGKDIVVGVDGSHSMLYAEDGRSENTRKELVEFIKKMQGTDRIGLVVFAGSARTASPLSIDYGNFEFKIGRLEREARGLKEGSDLASAVERAAKAFDSAKKLGDRDRILIIVSDGDVAEDDLKGAVDAAREHKLTVYTIGVGDPAGTKIAVPAGDGEGTEYLVDGETGQAAVTRLNETTLKSLAEATGGAYFRSKGDSSIDDILSRVAKIQKGKESDTLKTPRGVAEIFLFPALLLLILELLVPNAPMLRRRQVRSERPSGTKLHGGAWLALGLLPLSAWPQILPFAALITALSAFAAYDIFTRGAITRRVLAWIHRNEPVEGFDTGLYAVFADEETPAPARERYRKADHERVAAFVAAWKDADAAGRAALARDAGRDAELWREKLIAAALAESLRPSKDPIAVEDEISSALTGASRTFLSPFAPVLVRALGRREKVSWLAHPKALRPLARLAAAQLDPKAAPQRAALESLAGESDSAVAAAAKEALGGEGTARPRPSLARRAAIAGTSLFLSLLVLLTSFAGYKTVEYQGVRERAAETALSIFYDQDAYIFSDIYADERIPAEVLPILRNWHRGDKAAAEELGRALEILRDSPDPKADNLLEALFKRADLLPLTADSEKTLLLTLIERDNEMIWKFLQEYMVSQAGNPAVTRRLITMIEVGAEVGSEKVFTNLFYFLKSPNDQVRAKAIESIQSSLMDPARTGEFLSRLEAVSDKHAADPILQLWVQNFTLERLAQPGAGSLDISKVDGLLTKSLKAVAKADLPRVEAVKQVKPGEEDKLPAPALERAVALMKGAMERAHSAGGAVPDPMKIAVEKQLHDAVNALLKEGAGLSEGLRKSLQASGTLKPTPAPTYYDDEYDDYHGHYYPGGFGGRGYGGGYVDENAIYRDSYTMKQLREIRGAVAAARDAKMGEKGPAGLSPEDREYFDRALRVMDGIVSAGPLAGILEGGTAGEAAAAEANQILKSSYRSLPGQDFIAMLRSAGRAPQASVSGALDRAYAKTYSADELKGLVELYERTLAEGVSRDAAGKETALSWGHKKNLAAGIEEIGKILKKHYPGAELPAPSVEVSGAVRALAEAAKQGDAAAVAAARDRIATAFPNAPSKDAFLARFSAAVMAEISTYNDPVRLEVLRIVSELLVGDEGEKLDAAGVREILDKVAPHLFKAGTDQEGLTALLDALAANPAAPEVLKDFVRDQAASSAKRLIDAAKDALQGRDDAVKDLEAALEKTRVLKDGKARDNFKLYHLRELRSALHDAVAAAAKRPGAEAKKLKEFAAWADGTLGAAIEAGERAGLADGGSLGERAAEEVNDILHRGHMKFPGQTFAEAFRAQGLANPGSGYDREKTWFEDYSADRMVAVYEYLEKLLEGGKTWDYQGQPQNMDAAHAKFLAEAVEELDALILKFYPDAHAGLKTRPLGALLQEAAAGDSASRDLALRSLLATPSGAAALARLQAAEDRAGENPAATLEAARLLVALFENGDTTKIGQASGSEKYFVELAEELQESGREFEAWEMLHKALRDNRGAVPEALAELAAESVRERRESIIEDAEEAFDLKSRFVETGIRLSDTQHKATVKTKDLVKLRAEIEAAAAKAKTLTDEQKAAAAPAGKLLPKLHEIAVDAGLKPGDSPGELAAERVNKKLHAGYMKFPGSEFVKALRKEGLAPAETRGPAITAESAFQESYSRTDLLKLRDFLKGRLDAGMGWNYSGGDDPLDDAERAVIEEALYTVEELLAAPPAGASNTQTPLHGLAPAGLLLSAAIGGPVVIGLVLALTAMGVWLFLKHGTGLFKSPSQDEEPEPPIGPSKEVLQRFKRIEIASKKFATSVTVGQFRSRLIGTSGSSAVETAPYRNEDIRKVNWKATAKKGKLTVNRYEQEKDVPLILVIDVSGSAATGTRKTDKRTVISDAAALLALAAAHKNIRVGAVLVSDRIEEYIPPRGGQRQAWRIIRRAMEIEPKSLGTDLNAAADFLRRELRSRAIVAPISDFITGGFKGNFAALAERHSIFPIRVTDPSDMKPIPDVGLVRVGVAETGESRLVDTSSPGFRAEQSSAIRNREAEISDAFRASRADPVQLSTDGDYLWELAREFQGRKK